MLNLRNPHKKALVVGLGHAEARALPQLSSSRMMHKLLCISHREIASLSSSPPETESCSVLVLSSTDFIN